MYRSLESIDAILDSLVDHAVFTLDSDGNITSWNNAAERKKGYKAEDVIGRNFSIFYLPDEREAGFPQRALRTATETGRSESVGWRVRKDQSRFWANVVIQPLRSPNGHIEGFVKVVRDISDRLAFDKLRDELHQSQKLELVGHLTGGVAHDFNNLPTVIESTFELVRLTSVSEKVDRYLAINRIAIDRSRKMIDQLLEFGRKQVLDPKPADVNEVAVRFELLLQKAVGDQIAIKWLLAPGLPMVNTDEGYLLSALMNLVINARDAMPADGALTIFSELHELDADAYPVPFDVPAGTYVAVGVADNGSGMSPEILRQCTEPFFTTKDVGKGTGLGLSQCFGFARQSGGTLEIRSVQGMGTTVAILLPADPFTMPVRKTRKTVLLVEDDPAVRELAAELLRVLGNSVIECTDAAEALARLEHGDTIDVLFTDIVMPNGIDGVQLIVKAREIRPGLAAVLTSGYTRKVLHDAKDIPRDTPFLSKPYTLDELRDSLAGKSRPQLVH